MFFEKIAPLSSAIVIALLSSACTAEQSVEDQRVQAAINIPEATKTAVVGAGCFWCVEAFYENLDGVHDAISGYAGGTEESPTYEQVARGQTSHAEVIKIVYDPKSISYRELIDFFWTTHDATRSDGVWPDFGSQYRSILLYSGDEERAIIEASRGQYESETGKTVATEIKALDTFYIAETYHQDYAAKCPSDRYIQGVLNPKLKKLGLK